MLSPMTEPSTGPAGFPLTSWGMVLRLREDRRKGLETLCRRYWKPVFRFVRRTRPDAEDLTQAFFAWLLEGGEALARYAPERGSFRNYLKVILRGFLSDEDDRRRALKRGGGRKIVPLEGAERIPDDSGDPEALFDRAFRQEVLEEATRRARAAFPGDKAVRWRAFELYTAEKTTYAEVARTLGVKESDVRNWLFAARERIRDEVRSQLAETVGDAEELEREYRSLFG